MSNNNKVKKKKVDKTKLFTRILAFVLCALMVLGSLVIILQSRLFASALESTVDAQTVRIGLMYGDDVTVGFETSTPNGFSFGCVLNGSGFLPLYSISDSKISVTCDSNLAKTNMTYSKTKSSTPVIGGYHIELENNFATSFDTDSGINFIKLALGNFQYGVFPAYCDGNFRIRIGDFASENEAQLALNSIAPFINPYSAVIVSPTDSGVSVVNPETDVILFEYDCKKKSELGLAPLQSGTEEAYLITPAKNTYKGIFEFSRYIKGSTDGVALTNILPIEEYILGVLPYEISNSWHDEVLKAFAITARSYTLANIGKHNSAHGFDLCNSTHCQVYRGMNSVNEAVENAVELTKGKVLWYDGKIVSAFYSSSTGGVTVSAKDAWGGTNHPHLQAVITPWENYKSLKSGYWTVEVTPTQLLKELNSNGYNSLNSPIHSVKINKLAENSTYVYSVTITDTNGNSVTIERSDKIRIAMSEYINSANFVVGKAGETVDQLEYVPLDANYIQNGETVPVTKPAEPSQESESVTIESEPKTETETQEAYNIFNNNKPISKNNADDAQVTTDSSTEAENNESITGQIPDDSEKSVDNGVFVLTSSGRIKAEIGESVNIVKSVGGEKILGLSNVPVVTGSGTVQYDMISAYISGIELGFDEEKEVVDSPDNETTTPSAPLTVPTQYKTVINKVYLEGTPGNFVFVGKGMGHGVGLSQYGARHMANMGYSFDVILKSYFPGTDIVDYIPETSEDTDINKPENVPEDKPEGKPEDSYNIFQ